MEHTFLSTDAVMRRFGAAGQKLTTVVGLSCAESLNTGSDALPFRASKQFTIPSSDEARNMVGHSRLQARASASPDRFHLRGSPLGVLTSTCTITSVIDYQHCMTAGGIAATNSVYIDLEL